MLDFLLVGGLCRRLTRADPDSLYHAVFQRTWGPALFAIVFLAVAGAGFESYAPEAVSIGSVFAKCPIATVAFVILTTDGERSLVGIVRSRWLRWVEIESGPAAWRAWRGSRGETSRSGWPLSPHHVRKGRGVEELPRLAHSRSGLMNRERSRVMASTASTSVSDSPS